MNHVVHWLGSAVEALLRLFDGLAPWASLAIIGAVTALVVLVVIRRTSPQRHVVRARAQMAAALFEMRLYLDHPAMLLRAQGRLVVWTGAYLGLILPSLLVLALPLGLLFVHLDARHGVAPLPAGPAVVRIELDEAIDLRQVRFDATPPLASPVIVRAPDEHAVYARLAVERGRTYPLVVHAGQESATAEIVADPDADVVSRERRSGVSQLWALGAEPPLAGDAIRSITIPYPDRPSPFAVPWWAYWLGIATIVAMTLRRRFGVVF